MSLKSADIKIKDGIVTCTDLSIDIEAKKLLKPKSGEDTAIYNKRIRTAILEADGLDLEVKPNKRFTIITCVDCGKMRRIYTTDTHQVSRCKGCQKKLRNQKIAAKKKARRDANPTPAKKKTVAKKPVPKKDAAKKAPVKKTPAKKAATKATKSAAEELAEKKALGV